MDVLTLFIVSTCIVGLLGLFLFFAWIQDRNIRALAWWGAAYMLGGLGRGGVDRRSGADVAAALLRLVQRAAVRRLRHDLERDPAILRAPNPAFRALAGAIVWIVACQFPSFAYSGEARIILSSLIVSAYTFATAREMWTDRRKKSRSRWAAVCVPALHGLVFLPPIPLAVMHGGEGALLSSGWIAVFALETLLYVVGTAFIALMMAKEKAENLYKLAAATDPLTGLLNRRGFMERLIS